MKEAEQQTAEGILFTDQYQLTMAQVYFRAGLHERRVQFDLSVTDRHLFVSIDGGTLSGAVERLRFDAQPER